MTTAFVPSSSFTSPALARSSFKGSALSSPHEPRSVAVNTPTAKSALDRYMPMGEPSYSPGQPSKPSTWWVAFNNTNKVGNPPYRAPGAPAPVSNVSPAIVPGSLYARLAALIEGKTFPAGGDPAKYIGTPTEKAADAYMAQCMVKQYKAFAAPFGVYNVQCTEGTVKGQAEESRNASLSASFRMNHRSVAQKFGDFFENRKNGLIAAHGCSYEEGLVNKFPTSARTFVTSSSEALGNCVRYADGVTTEEKYMASCVDKQMKFRAVPTGVYDVLCSDGNAKGVAEFKRVSAMSAIYRAKQLPALAQEQAKYNNASYARQFFGHGCSYEEELFNKYPAVSASMRPSTARY